jgi:hypothetical protein
MPSGAVDPVRVVRDESGRYVFRDALLFAAFILQSVQAEHAAERIRQAQYCAAAERRAQHRAVDLAQPVAMLLDRQRQAAV